MFFFSFCILSYRKNYFICLILKQQHKIIHNIVFFLCFSFHIIIYSVFSDLFLDQFLSFISFRLNTSLSSSGLSQAFPGLVQLRYFYYFTSTFYLQSLSYAQDLSFFSIYRRRQLDYSQQCNKLLVSTELVKKFRKDSSVGTGTKKPFILMDGLTTKDSAQQFGRNRSEPIIENFYKTPYFFIKSNFPTSDLTSIGSHKARRRRDSPK